MAARIWGRLLTPAYNWHWIEKPGDSQGGTAGLARSAQLYAIGGHTTTLLRHHGIRSIVNLRGENPGKPWHDNLKATAADLGIAMNSIALSSRRLPDKAALLRLLDLLSSSERPTLMLCSGGADRTSFAAALAVLDARGIEALPTARRHLRPFPYFHIPKKHQRWIRVFFDWFEDTRNERPLRQWLEESYSRDAFATWMRNKGMQGYWRE